jgi:hypothetical protein
VTNECISNLVIICDVTGISVKCKQSENLNIFNQSVSVDELLPIKAHLNMRGRLIHHYNNYDA